MNGPGLIGEQLPGPKGRDRGNAELAEYWHEPAYIARSADAGEATQRQRQRVAFMIRRKNGILLLERGVLGTLDMGMDVRSATSRGASLVSGKDAVRSRPRHARSRPSRRGAAAHKNGGLGHLA